MPIFRKRPVVIEARQMTRNNEPDVWNWVGNAMYFDGLSYCIRTLEGHMIVREYDWIIKGIHNEFYPCKPDIFEKTYELVS